jgi:hypothetical protein
MINSRNTWQRITLTVVAGMVVARAEALTLVTAPSTLSKAGETYRLTANVTATGTAFQITASNVVLDLNGHTVTYGNSSTAASNGVQIRAGNVKVGNGTLVQGAANAAGSHGIDLDGNGAEIHHLIIKVTGADTHGVNAVNADLGSIHHVFVESSSPSSTTGDPPAGLWLQASGQAGLTINNNIVVGAMRGMTLTYFGLDLYPNMPTQSHLYQNLLVPDRIYGDKGPYGIYAARCSNLDIDSNQIVSDQGRGIIMDGYEQGTPSGTTHNLVHNNLIDVQYSPNPRTGGGTYPESDVYGVRDRYGSGDNTISNNTIIVDNKAGGASWGLYLGSDAYEASMKNIVASNNVVIERNDPSLANSYNADCVTLDYGESVSITNSQYQCAHQFVGYDWDNTLHFTTLTNTGNTALAMPTSAPSAPSGLHGRRMLDRVVLEWTPSTSSGTYEYRVYRDGKRISSSDVGGYFFIDTYGSGDPVYSVTAVNLAGQESSASAGLNLSATDNGWNVVAAGVAPNAPSGLTVK